MRKLNFRVLNGGATVAAITIFGSRVSRVATQFFYRLQITNNRILAHPSAGRKTPPKRLQNVTEMPHVRLQKRFCSTYQIARHKTSITIVHNSPLYLRLRIFANVAKSLDFSPIITLCVVPNFFKSFLFAKIFNVKKFKHESVIFRPEKHDKNMFRIVKC